MRRMRAPEPRSLGELAISFEGEVLGLRNKKSGPRDPTKEDRGGTISRNGRVRGELQLLCPGGLEESEWAAWLW